jgi:hypothetical protein
MRRRETPGISKIFWTDGVRGRLIGAGGRIRLDDDSAQARRAGARQFSRPKPHDPQLALGLFLIPHRGCPPVSQPQKIVDLALSPAMILGRQRIDASIHADVANQELRALDKVRHLINGSPTETTCASRHGCAPVLPNHVYLTLASQIHKWPKTTP